MDASFWKGYRRKTGSLTWRLATPEDVPRIRHLGKIMERFLGLKQDFPDMFARPVLLCLVAENEAGQIVDGLYIEAKAEILKINCTARGYAGMEEIKDDLQNWLKGIGFRYANIVAPRKIKGKMLPQLKRMGFWEIGSRFSHWMRRL